MRIHHFTLTILERHDAGQAALQTLLNGAGG